MQILRSLGLKVVILVMAMLAAIGAWEVYRGTVNPARSDIFGDVFKCYRVDVLEETLRNGRRLHDIIIKTTDQIAIESLRLKEGELVCFQARARILSTTGK